MNLQKLTMCTIIVGLALAILMFYSILSGDSIISMIAVIIALTSFIILRSRVQTVTVDERVHLVSEKASRKALQIFVFSVSVDRFGSNCGEPYWVCRFLPVRNHSSLFCWASVISVCNLLALLPQEIWGLAIRAN